MKEDIPGTALEEALKKVHPFLREAGASKLSELRLPNLIGVGSSRSGTSTLYGMLRNCPDVYAAPMKEVNYFGICDAFTGSGPMSLREYKLCFAAQSNQKYIAEVTPVYLSTLASLGAIRATLGDIKIVVNLRDPVDRLVSHFKYHQEFHGFHDIDAYLATALQQYRLGRFGSQWTAPCQGILHSLYAPGLEQILALFSEENVLILRYDDLVANGRWAPALSAFLSVDVKEDVEPRYRNQSTRDRIRPAGSHADQLFELIEKDLGKLSALGVAFPKSWLP